MAESKERIEFINDDKWFEMLLKSIKSRTVDGVEFPGFPAEALQTQFVGSSNESAMREGFGFYSLVKRNANLLGKPFDNTTKFLDFGCGWGRLLRIFRKEIAEENLFGVDVDPTILDECRKNKVPGELSRIFPDGKLPYPDAFFDCVIAYSVFTHLPELVHKHWISEIARVAKPGCFFVLTLESVRFLDFVENAGSANPKSAFQEGFRRFSSEVPLYRKMFSEGKIVYLPSGGGDFRPQETYGDAIVPLTFIEQTWKGFFNIIDYIDDPAAQGNVQAILIAQRT
jgi:ubiquinone/menaquinone biosynthesis C-methylase UbiE